MVPADPTWAIRRAEGGDAKDLSMLAYLAKAHWGYSFAFMEACRDELTYDGEAVRRYPFYLIRNGEAIVGFYALAPGAEGAMDLEALFVAPSHHGRGYGRALLTHARGTAQALGADRLTVQSDPNADAFYEALGGRCTGERESRSIPGRMLRTFDLDLRA